MRYAEHLQDIKCLKPGREVEANVLRYELVGCDALILNLQENMKFIEGGMNTLKT